MDTTPTQTDQQQAIIDWIHTTLAAQHIAISGAIQVIHAQPWSTILRIPTGETALFCKATAGFAQHEIALTAYLSQVRPEVTPQILAVHPQQPWMLLRDGGQRLRELLVAQPDWSHWQKLLPQFADLQMAVASHREELLAVGLPHRSLEIFPRLYADLIAQTAFFQPDSEERLSDAEYQRLHDLIPVVEQKAQLLAAYAVPQTIHHGDLHDANIFCPDGNYAFYDWGDASWSHPFFSLRTAYVSAEMRFGLDENAPELDQLREAYLPAWRAYETDANLQTVFGLAQELWAISSAFLWYEDIRMMDAEQGKEFVHVLPSLAREFMGLIRP